MQIPIIFALLASLGGRAQEPQQVPAHVSTDSRTTCPAGNEGTRRIMDRFLQHDGYAGSRAETGTVGLSSRDVRPLGDERDAEECARLNRLFGAGGGQGEWVWAYYRAGNRYFVAVHRADQQRIWMGHVPLYVFDENFEPIGSYAM